MALYGNTLGVEFSLRPCVANLPIRGSVHATQHSDGIGNPSSPYLLKSQFHFPSRFLTSPTNFATLTI